MKRLPLVLLALAAACGDSDLPPTDPSKWHEAFDATGSGWLMNVWASAQDHVLVAGGRPDAGQLLAFDGSDWKRVELGVQVPLLNWTQGFGPADVTVVGNEGTILHFDGQEWTQQESPTDEDLWGVWGTAPGDLWAVGGGGFSKNVPVVLHHASTGWTLVPIPELQKANVFALYKVWGSGPSDVWMVGQRGVVLHWNGAALEEVLVGASDDIVSLWGENGHILAVGGRANGQLSTFDGSTWKTQILPELPGLNGVWTRDGDTFHVAGTDGTLLKIRFDPLQYERTSIDTRDDFHSIYGVDDTLFAVGGSLGSLSGPYRGLAYRRSLASGE